MATSPSMFKWFEVTISTHRIAFALVWIAASAVTLFLGTQVSVFFLDSDSIQHLSVARNLMTGHGISTSILYLPLQYNFGTVPAPQTSWPPGEALFVAVLGMLGIDPVHSLFASSIAAVALTAPVVYLTVRTVQVRVGLALAAALFWLVIPASWYFAIRGMTEGPFALFVALSGFTLARASLAETNKSNLWFATGCFAALAFLWRYQGIFLLPALALGVLLASFRQPISRLVLRAFLVLGPLAVVIGMVFTRNKILTDVFSGGQISNVVDPQPLVLALKMLFWVVEKQFSYLVGEIDNAYLRRVLMFVTVILMTWGMIECLIRGCFRKSNDSIALAASATAGTAMGYVAVTMGFYLWAGITKASFFISQSSGQRYFIVLFPSLLVVGAVAFEYLLKRFSTYGSVRYISLAALVAVVLIGFKNFELLQDRPWIMRIAPHVKYVKEILDKPSSNGILLRKHIVGINDLRCPILSSFPHQVYFLTGRDTVGLTSFELSNLIWDSTLTLALIEKLGICQILVINKDFDEHKSYRYHNQDFLRDLAHGGTHPRLALVAEVPGARLFNVSPPAQTK